MKQIKSKFWHMLEDNPRRIATRPDWQRASASEYRLFQDMIYPVDGLATEITDPDNIGGRRLLVVDYCNGKYAALDSVTENIRGPLTLDDIIRLTFDLNKFRGLLSQVLGFETVSDTVPPNSLAPIRFGTCRIKPGVEFPIYLILAPGCRFMAERLRVLLTTEKNSFFLLTATRRTWTQEVLQLVHDRKSQIVSLEECLLVDNGQFVKSETWDNAVNAFRVAHFPDDLVTAPPPYEFRKCGQGWLVRFEGKEMFLKGGKGAQYTAFLLSKPGKSIFASDLLAIIEGKDPKTVYCFAAAGTASDKETLREIEKEYQTLRADLERARADGDLLVEQEVLGEMSKLEDYVRKATDGRGKLRKVSDDSDTHRQSVFRAIDRTIDDIAKELPNCGVHLRNQIRTGMEISYEPEKNITWKL